MTSLATLNRARKDAETILDGCAWGRVPDWNDRDCRDAYEDRREALQAIAAYNNGRGTVRERFDRFWTYVQNTTRAEPVRGLVGVGV